MSVPALGRASLPPGPSCVHHFTVITVLLVTTAVVVASSQPKDLCRMDPVIFADQIHTIGLIDGELWAITKRYWNVYKLTPCNPANYSLVHCMEVDSPVEVDTKWPKLVESVKSASKEKDLSFTVDNSAVMDTSNFGFTVLAMHGDSFNGTNYFGFDFGRNKSIDTSYMKKFPDMYKGLWISSNEKDKAFRLLDSQVERIKFVQLNDGSTIYLTIEPVGSQKSICRVGSKDDRQVQFQEGECNPATVWSVSKGVLYNKQFYLFASDLVYIFSDQAQTGLTRMQTVALADFFHCYEPSTMPHPTSPNATNHQFIANSSNMTTTAKGSSTIIIIVGVLLVAILALIIAYYCWCHTKASNDGKSDGNTNRGSSSPKNSKLSSKARTISKGSLKHSPTKVKTLAPKLSSGKQSQH